MNLYIDLETIPGQKPWLREEIAKTIKHPGTMKKPETIKIWEETKKDAAIDADWLKTALNGTSGEIICASYAIDDEPITSVKRTLGGSDEILIAQLFVSISSDIQRLSERRALTPIWIGHNITGFDLRFLWQRCIINKVKPPIEIPVTAKPWDSTVFDTYTEWAGLKSSGGNKLNDICKAFGIPNEDTIDGSQVWECVKKGDIDTVVKHCEWDVEKVRQIYKRMNFL